eukprot:g25551.t1
MRGQLTRGQDQHIPVRMKDKNAHTGPWLLTVPATCHAGRQLQEDKRSPHHARRPRREKATAPGWEVTMPCWEAAVPGRVSSLEAGSRYRRPRIVIRQRPGIIVEGWQLSPEAK